MVKIGDDRPWEAQKRELQKKYGVKRLPTSLTELQKRAREKVWPAQRTPKRHIPLETFYRARIEGIREGHPPEVRVYSALYQEDRRRKKRWEIELTPEDLNSLNALVGDALAKGKGEKDKEKLAKIWDRYENKLAEVIEAWAKQHSQSASGMVQLPSKKEERKRREWMLRMGFVSLKDFKLPILPKHPFGHYFLTVNVFAKLYGLSPLIADAILSRMSEIYQRAKKGERPPGAAVAPSEMKTKQGKRTEWQTQSESIKARGAEETEQVEIYGKFLSHAEILSEQHDKYVEAMRTISRQAAREISNLEAHLPICFRNAPAATEFADSRKLVRNEEIADFPGEERTYANA